MLTLAAVFFSGCSPYDSPELLTIEPSQTAFLVPLDGRTSDQANFMSEEFLSQSKVATKKGSNTAQMAADRTKPERRAVHSDNEIDYC